MVKNNSKSNDVSNDIPDKTSKMSDSSKDTTEKSKKPSFLNRLIVSFSISIISFLLFSLIYSSLGMTNFNSLMSNMGDKIYDYSSPESRESFFGILSEKCDQMSLYMNSLGITDKMSSSDISLYLSRSGLNDTQILYISSFNQICKNRYNDEKVFFGSFIQFILSQSKTSEQGSVSNILDSIKENPEIDENTKVFLSILGMIYSFISSPIRVIAGIIVLLGIIIFFSFGFWNYLLGKISKIFIGLGISLILPFIILKYLVSKNPIDTSFIFSGLSQLLNGTSSNIANIFMGGLKDIGLLLFEIIYPMKIVFAGLVLLLIGIGVFITSKVVN